MESVSAKCQYLYLLFASKNDREDQNRLYADRILAEDASSKAEVSAFSQNDREDQNCLHTDRVLARDASA